MPLSPHDTQVTTLGERRVPSPLKLSTVFSDGLGNYVPDRARVRYQVELHTGQDHSAEVFFEKAGPRELIYFEPEQTRAAMVTCGGLCPGLNNVIRSAFLELYHNYGVREVLGIPYGFQGLNPAEGKPPIRLTPELVNRIHAEGGTILGSSRGPQATGTVVDFLVRERINLLLCVGGDGTQRGTHDIATEVQRRQLPIAVVGIPKTIDNDIAFVYRTFGFASAVERAREVLAGAHTEAKGAFNGIGLVKLMGRQAGFIAATAALASQEANFVLVPEVPFHLEGEHGLLVALRQRLARRHHAVLVVAEGAGQDLLGSASGEPDASGNPKLGDIGGFLKEAITAYFKREAMPAALKYLDPSYYIRSVAANSADSLLCDQFARNAVHAAMAGKTDVLIGLWYNVFTHVPIPLVTRNQKRLDPECALWRSVLAATGQPRLFQ